MRDFSKTYEIWLYSQDLREKKKLEQYLNDKLAEVWRAHDPEAKILCMDFIRLAKRSEVPLIVKALRDEDSRVASNALGMIAFLVRAGHTFDVVHLKGELENFARLHPDEAAVCDHVAAQL